MFRTTYSECAVESLRDQDSGKRRWGLGRPSFSRVGNKNRNLHHIPAAGQVSVSLWGLYSVLQWLWWEGGHWCQHPPLNPGQREKGGTERASSGNFSLLHGHPAGQKAAPERGFCHYPPCSPRGNQKQGPHLNHRKHSPPLRVYCSPSEMASTTPSRPGDG